MFALKIYRANRTLCAGWLAGRHKCSDVKSGTLVHRIRQLPSCTKRTYITLYRICVEVRLECRRNTEALDCTSFVAELRRVDQRDRKSPRKMPIGRAIMRHDTYTVSLPLPAFLACRSVPCTHNPQHVTGNIYTLDQRAQTRAGSMPYAHTWRQSHAQPARTCRA